MSLNRKLVALVHVAKAQLGLDEATYRGVLYHHGGGVLSAKDLDQDGFDGVMAYMNRCGFRSTSGPRRQVGQRPGRASPKQLGLIRKLWREWSGGEDGAALDRWVEGSFGVSSLRFATPETADKAINGLRAMNRRKGASPSRPRGGIARPPEGSAA